MSVTQQLHTARDAFADYLENQSVIFQSIEHKLTAGKLADDLYNKSNCEASVATIEPDKITSPQEIGINQYDAMASVVRRNVTMEENFVSSIKPNVYSIDATEMMILEHQKRYDITSAIIIDTKISSDLLCYLQQISSIAEIAEKIPEESAKFVREAEEMAELLGQYVIADPSMPRSAIYGVAVNDCASNGIVVGEQTLQTETIKAVNKDLRGADEERVEEIKEGLRDVAKNAEKAHEMKSVAEAVVASIEDREKESIASSEVD